jgi:hypothetical protein
MKILNLRRHKQGDVFADISTSVPPEDLKEVVDCIVMLWTKLTSVMGPFPGNIEKASSLYIADVMQILVPLFSNYLRLEYEHFIKDEQFGGQIDMVVHADTLSKLPVVYIVEAKKNDINQGRAQLYPQLKICHELAKKEENWDHPIFGVISTVKEWIFVRFDGEKWLESNPFYISSENDRHSIEKLIEGMYKIMLHQSMLVKDLVDKFDKK